MKQIANYCMIGIGLLTTLIIPQVIASEKQATNILFVIDCSHRMSIKWETTTKFDAMKSTLREVLAEVSKEAKWGVNAGIRVFGDQNVPKKHDCEDTRLVVGLEWLDPNTLSSALDGLKLKGTACPGSALKYVEKDFEKLKVKSTNHIILITSGSSECKTDETAVLTELKKNIPNLISIHTLGVNLDEPDIVKLKQTAEKSGTLFINIADVANLKAELSAILTQIMENSNPTASSPLAK